MLKGAVLSLHLESFKLKVQLAAADVAQQMQTSLRDAVKIHSA